jgi:hypothetical protein
MHLRRGIGMCANEMMQHMQQFAHVLAIVSRLRRPDVIGNQAEDRFGAMVLVDKVLAQRDGSYLRDVFMFGNRQNLLFGEVATAKAILQSDHDSLLPYRDNISTGGGSFDLPQLLQRKSFT